MPNEIFLFITATLILVTSLYNGRKNNKDNMLPTIIIAMLTIAMGIIGQHTPTPMTQRETITSYINHEIVLDTLSNGEIFLTTIE